MIKYKVQSVYFKKRKFSKEQAISWLLSHNYKFIKIHETDDYYKFRQNDPEQLKKEGYTDYKNISLNNGVILVLVYRPH
jgi:hypothetical protein